MFTDNGTGQLFMGLDSSTQSLKATVIDHALNVVYETSVNFDRDLSEFKTDGGVHRSESGLRVTSPAIMWVKALDMVLAKMRADDCPCERIVAISGSGQQHGSVWFKRGARAVLNGLGSEHGLAEQLADIFSINRGVLKIMADVFGSPVYVSDKSDSASLGAAYRAMHGWLCEKSDIFIAFKEIFRAAPPFAKAFEPDAAAHAVYSGMLERYAQLEKTVAG